MPPAEVALAQLSIAFLTSLRLLGLFVVAPWLGLGVRPGAMSLALSVAGAIALLPLILAAGPVAAPVGLQLLAAGMPELLRGLVLGLGCGLPFVVLRGTGSLADSLRGSHSPSDEDAGLARLYAYAALTAALALSAQLGVVRIFIEGLRIAPLGSELGAGGNLAENLRGVADWMFHAFELSVSLAAPILLSGWVAALLFGLSMRAAGPLAAAGPSTLLPWFGLGVVCLSIAGTLDEIPGVVRLFSRETLRLLEALH